MPRRQPARTQPSGPRASHDQRTVNRPLRDGDRGGAPELVRLDGPLTSAKLLAVQRTAGNQAARQLVTGGPAAPPVSVQRQAGENRGWVTIQPRSVDLSGDPLVGRLRQATAGWPVKITKAEFSYGGSLKRGSGSALGGGVRFGAATGVEGDYRLLEAALLRDKLGGDAPSLSVTGNWALNTGKTELSAKVTGSIFGYSLSGTLIVAKVGWDDQTLARTGRPEADLLSGEVKGSRTLSFDFRDSQDVPVSFAGSAGIAVAFEPNWAMLGRYLLRGVGSMAPTLIPLGAAAGLAGLVWSGYVNARQQQDVYHRTRVMARQLIRDSERYADRMVFPRNGGEGSGGQGTARGDADLARVLAARQLSTGHYLGALDLEEIRGSMFSRLSRDYAINALTTLERRMHERVSAWHSEHWLVSFLSGSKEGETNRMVTYIVDLELSRGGRDVLSAR